MYANPPKKSKKRSRSRKGRKSTAPRHRGARSVEARLSHVERRVSRAEHNIGAVANTALATANVFINQWGGTPMNHVPGMLPMGGMRAGRKGLGAGRKRRALPSGR